MAAEAGLKPNETDALSPNEVWIVLEGHNEREKAAWERVRAQAYITAKFGNSDPNKFPKSAQRFWPFQWDNQKAGGVQRARGEDIRAQWEERKKLREQLSAKAQNKAT